jgi:hypothetical protein
MNGDKHHTTMDDDDEFFGSQDDDEDGSNLRNEFGKMGVHECQAREKELRNIGFMDAYDECKEMRLQQGFETGFQETFEVCVLLGELLGEVTTLRMLEDRSLARSKSPASSITPSPPSSNAQKVTLLVHDFFAVKFQKDESKNARPDIEALVDEIRTLLKRDNYKECV